MSETLTPPPAAPPSQDGYIGARKNALIRALLARDAPPRMESVFGLLGAILHHDAQAEIDTLKDLYHPIDPDAPDQGVAPPAAFDAFESKFVALLKRANFRELDPESVESRKAAKLVTGLNIKTSNAGIRKIRFFARGAKAATIERRELYGLRKRRLQADVFRDVIVLAAFKPEQEIAEQGRKAISRIRGGVRPGAALVKHFRNVARAELLSLHPGAEPAMLRRDQVMLAVPAVAGGVPILLQIGPAVVVIFTVIAAWFGMGGVIENSQLRRALTAASGLIALGAFVMRQWVKYERQTLKYQKQLADTVYFRCLSNNSAVLDTLIGEAEAQDCKEAALAYWALARADQGLTRAQIDEAAETFLRQHMGLNVDFEIGDALAKIERLGLATREGELYRAVPIDDALHKLDVYWDGLYQFAKP